MKNLISKCMQINEVEYAVAAAKNGAAVDDDSFEGATHAAQAGYISMIAGKIGNQMGVGNLKVAAIHGSHRHILMYQQKNVLINVIVSGSTQLGSIEQTIQKTLSSGHSGSQNKDF